ncbi:Y-family DNA polymerase [Alteromonas confluentis]|uniref:UmuC domain-containing protein n=1 Tax=Alteromonas confluentis TaxID=1656094 RepID=A0A1E7ZAI1_9ALTE|nr:DNA polymerase Y family protein [Alteromonas confluentis]OFC70462.1 hypothetical protein BFC18_14990 [Alteromonas confluentis]
MARQRWLCLHFFRLTLDNAKANGSVPDQQPAVAYHQASNNVLQVNSCARKVGIEVGMGLAHAAALCENLTVIDYAEEIEHSQLRLLAASLYQCAAEISLQPPCRLFIRIDNLVRYYGDYQQIWLAIKNTLHHREVNFVFACGWSPENAEALAKRGQSSFLLCDKKIENILAALPVQALSIADKHANALQRAGIRHAGELLKLPPTELGKRFDSELLKYLFALRGESQPQRLFYHPPANFSHSVLLTYEVEDATRLQRYLDQCLRDMELFLRLRNAGSQAINITLYFREAPEMPISVRKSDVRFSFSEWQQLIKLKLETLELPAPVTHFEFSSEKPRSYAADTADFFNSRKHLFARQLLFGRLAARLGEDAISVPHTLQDHRFTSGVESESDNTQDNLEEFTPTYLLKHPQPLTDSPKIEFGPVRIESGWWDGNKEKRDYFIGRNQHGQRIQIFRENGNWFLNGWYA